MISVLAVLPMTFSTFETVMLPAANMTTVEPAPWPMTVSTADT